MSNEVAVRQESGGLPALAMNERELMTVLEGSLYPGAAPESIKMVIGYCKASGLDPMQKPVHIVPVWDGKAQKASPGLTAGRGLKPGIAPLRTRTAPAGVRNFGLRSI